MSVTGNTTRNTARENHDLFYSERWLDYNLKNLLWQKWGMMIKFPQKAGNTIHIKAWNPPDTVVTPVPLVEGVTPDSKKLARREVSTQLVWYGNFLEHTDLLEIIFEDADNLMPAENEYLGTLQAEERDTAMFHILIGGTNVIYANNESARSSVDSPLTIAELHLASRTLKNGLNGRAGKPVTRMLSSNGNFGTVDIEPAYIVVIAPDLEYDVRSLPGFAPVSSYANGASNMIDPHEFGKVDNFRFVTTTLYQAFEGAGASSVGKNVLNTSNVTDVYPVIIFSQDAYATIPLVGHEGMTLIRKQLGSSGSLDPLNQRATVGYKNPFAGVILYQERLIRIECGATAIPGL